ncbi:MAG: efflux RND transporter permease subunit [Pseudomonadota bacterium]
MNLIRGAIERPVAVVAAVILVIMFGVVALQQIPIQLTPDVRKPVINIETQWFGAAPAEVEREIVNRQEEVLRGVEGLEKMTSRSETGEAKVELEFAIGTDMGRSLLLVANRLDRVSGYPNEADEPTLSTAGSGDNPIAWFVMRRVPGNDRDINTYGDFVEDIVKDRIERVDGVGLVNVFGGSEREMRVVIDPARMARYGLTVTDTLNALRAGNAAVSAGDVDEGKRRYVVRVEGDYESTADVERVVVRTQSDPLTGRVARVTVADIADVTFGYKEPRARIRLLGDAAIAMNAVRETGANVIETMAGIQAALDELNATALPQAGLTLVQVYDETTYIDAAIDLVTSNIYIGGVLAAFILMIFLRNARATLVVSLAIPVSVVGSFVAMAALGRSLNVISLAGIAFAVGMVVDAAIVVLENIYRHRENGMSAKEAAYKGASQVWGAVFASALTTVAVFVPILIMQLEVGQLFRDIAVAISVAVVLSLLVSITVIPALAQKLLGGPVADSATRMRLPLIDDFAGFFLNTVLGFTRWMLGAKSRAAAVVVLLSTLAVTATLTLMPKLEYLPNGNRNLVFGIIIPPPGYNLDTMSSIAQGLEDSIKHLWTDSIDADEARLEDDGAGEPKMSRFFFVALPSRTFVGGAAADPSRVGELIPILRRPVFREPGTFGLMTQPSLFGRGIGGGRNIELDVSGPDLPTILGIAQQAAGLIFQTLPRNEGNQFRPLPGLELGAPEIRVLPDRTRLADAGVSTRELGNTVDAFNDGIRVDEITVDGKRIDLMLAGPENQVRETQGIEQLPVVTRTGEILPTSALASVDLTAGPTEIRHLERVRTITLQITPSDAIPLEEALDRVNENVVAPLLDRGLPPDVRLSISGTADKLTTTWNVMKWDLALAVIIVYLVMAVLFESFRYPLLIIVTVPLATAGGFIGLGLLNLFVDQKLDMLTLLGFIILIGIVVNNAILLVDQTLHHMRSEGYTKPDAILEATRNRVRPIFMSTLTSVFGMMPLVVFPGAGSELYRGLGSVVVGGLSLSAVLTLGLIPPLLRLFALDERKAPDQPESGATDGPGPVARAAE